MLPLLKQITQTQRRGFGEKLLPAGLGWLVEQPRRSTASWDIQPPGMEVFSARRGGADTTGPSEMQRQPRRMPAPPFQPTRGHRAPKAACNLEGSVTFRSPKPQDPPPFVSPVSIYYGRGPMLGVQAPVTMTLKSPWLSWPPAPRVG